MRCVQCKDLAESCFQLSLNNFTKVQIYNLCSSCAAVAWNKFNLSEFNLIISPPKTSKEFKDLAQENSSNIYSDYSCEYLIL